MFDLNDCSQDKIDRSVYITNLSFKINNEDLERIFSQVGKVEASHAFYDKELLRPAGRGIVLFSKKEESQRAIKELDGIPIKGRKIRVQLNTKCIKLLNFKRGSTDDESHDQFVHRSNISSEHSHENIHLSRASSSRRPLSGRRHSSHKEHHSVSIDNYDYDYDYDFHRRDRERSRERDKNRHSIGKYDHEYEYERIKFRSNIESIDHKNERRQLNSRSSDIHDEKKNQESPTREKKLIRNEFNDHELVSEKENENDSQLLYLHAPPIINQALLPPPPIMQMAIPLSSAIMQDPTIKSKSLEYDQKIHSISIADELFSDIGTDIPHSIWTKVIKKRAHDVYDRLFSITNDHQIIKDKVLLRFPPNEALAVANFIDALSPSVK